MTDDISALRAQIAALSSKLDALEAAKPAVASDAPVSRRGALGKAAAIAAGAVGGAFLLEKPAAAADDGNVIIGALNAGSTSTVITTPANATDAKVAMLVSDYTNEVETAQYRAAFAAWSHDFAGVYAYSDNAHALQVKGPAGIRSYTNGPTITSEHSSIVGGKGLIGQWTFSHLSASIATCIKSEPDPIWALVGFNSISGNGRLMDTRNGTNTTKARLTSTTPRDVQTLGKASIPNSTSVKAVAYSITVNTPSTGGYLKIGPKDGAQATVVNYTEGVSISASGLCAMGTDGKITVTIYGGTADVIIDVTGFFV